MNYMETGVLSSLQLTSMFPNLVLENFYVKTKNSIDAGLKQAPYGYVIPVQRDMTRPAELVRILRLQGIEVGTANAEIKIGDASYPAGSYVIKGGQPYWRLAKNLLEKQNYPDPALQHLRRQRLDDGLRVQRGREGNRRQGDPRRADDAREVGRAQGQDHRHRRGGPGRGALRFEQHDLVPLQGCGTCP